MKTIMMYQCEKCRKIYDSAIQAMTCEAAHYGLTLEEYYHWRELLKTVKEAGKKVYENIKKINFEGIHYRTDIWK